jgi:hypothetical protein
MEFMSSLAFDAAISAPPPRFSPIHVLSQIVRFDKSETPQPAMQVVALFSQESVDQDS